MFSLIVRTLGFLGLVLSIGYFIYTDNFADPSRVAFHIQTTRQIAIVSAVLVLLGYVLKYAAEKAGVGAGRCKKCGKVIPKTEMYCFDHRREKIWEAQEQSRHAGGKIKSKA